MTTSLYPGRRSTGHEASTWPNKLSCPSGKCLCLNKLNIRNIFNSNSTSYCQCLALIATSRPLVAHLCNAIIKSSNQSLQTYILVVTLITDPLPNRCHVNFSNQIQPIAATKSLTRKGNIRLMIFINLCHILKAFIQPWIRISRRFNIQIKVLMSWTRILSTLRTYVENVKPLFF